MYGLVMGSSIRSCRVRTASVFGSLMFSGSLSNVRRGSTANPDSPNAANASTMGRRHCTATTSNGRSQGNPTSATPICGRRNPSMAGSTVTVQRNAISIPTPAISPSCATPTNAVGVNAMNPAALASDATSTCPPARRARCSSAAGVSAEIIRASRNRTVIWMPKSTAMPTNRTANATLTRFSVPTASAANPVVSNKPSASVSRIGTISRQLRTARNNHSATSTVLPTRPSTAPSATVANSSSSSATDPVSRTWARPALTNSSPAAAARMAWVGAWPGTSAP